MNQGKYKFKYFKIFYVNVFGSEYGNANYKKGNTMFNIRESRAVVLTKGYTDRD